jgi:hypothetical protein
MILEYIICITTDQRLHKHVKCLQDSFLDIKIIYKWSHQSYKNVWQINFLKTKKKLIRVFVWETKARHKFCIISKTLWGMRSGIMKQELAGSFRRFQTQLRNRSLLHTLGLRSLFDRIRRENN